jgi:FAD/FMN-containing dehydrogenase
MGGYIQGGGHSPLSSIYGIAADQVLSYSVVLASGQFVTASPTTNPDLFFALRGGGGSTFGIVTSVTIKAYPDFPVTTTTLAFSPSTTVSLANFWAGVRAYFNYFIPHSNAGIYSYIFGIPGPSPTFSIAPFFAPNKTSAQTLALLSPWLNDLAALNITLTPTFTTHPNFLSAWQANFPQEGVGGAFIFGSRLFPRSNWLSKTSLDATFNAWKESIDAGGFCLTFNFAPRYYGPGSDPTSVNPAWRETVMHAMQIYSWPATATDAQILEVRKLLTERQKAWRDVSPGAGAYLGESDREEVGWQQSFYGSHYARLLRIKRSVDPWDVFWAKTAVGSEGWAVRTGDVLGDENGILCRV